MKAVANAGPLIALGKLGLAHLLHALYDPVLVPLAVHEEVVTRALELDQPDAYVIQLAVARQELVVVTMEDEDLSDSVQHLPLHRGEKHTIQLGLREAADWVLMDDLLSRECAQRFDLKAKGTLGVIVAAYRHRLISFQELELVLQDILGREDIWIHSALVRRIWDQMRKEAVSRG